jgi:hypothetical protein
MGVWGEDLGLFRPSVSRARFFKNNRAATVRERVGLSVCSGVTLYQTVFLFDFIHNTTAHSLPNGRGSVVFKKNGHARGHVHGHEKHRSSVKVVPPLHRLPPHFPLSSPPIKKKRGAP